MIRVAFFLARGLHMEKAGYRGGEYDPMDDTISNTRGERIILDCREYNRGFLGLEGCQR